MALKPIKGRPGCFVDEATGKEIVFTGYREVRCRHCNDSVGGCKNCQRFTCTRCTKRKSWSKAAYVDGLCESCFRERN